jgi:cephalosporin hydroxylase
MFDFESFYESIAQSLPDNSVIAEVGVADGASAIYLAESILNLGKTVQFYLIDDLSYGGGKQYRELWKNLRNADLLQHVEIMPKNSLEASCEFPDNHFDFVFIDASHRYELTKADVRLWHRKVKENCVLAGHDYNDGEGREVKMAVDEVIPKMVTRTDIPDRVFVPETVLHVLPTKKECGIWWVRKTFYAKLI